MNALTEPSVTHRYPDTRDTRGKLTTESVALWLTENGWTLGEFDSPCGPLAVAERLLKARQAHVATYLDRGGVLL